MFELLELDELPGNVYSAKAAMCTLWAKCGNIIRALASLDKCVT